MGDFYTIKTFSHSTDMMMVRSRLMAEEIEFRVLDELTVDTDPFFSAAVGGIKLQVQEKDYERVAEILAEEGYPVQTHIPPSKFYTFFDKHSSTLPLIGHLRIEWRAMIIVGTLTLIMAGLVLFFTTPPIEERLKQNSWCIEHIIYNEIEYTPHTQSPIKVTGEGYCDEGIRFISDRIVQLPGFDTDNIKGNWTYYQDTLFIFNIDEFSNIYNGSYTVKFSGSKLTLKSKRTTIYCSMPSATGAPVMSVDFDN